ncbi:hypothetical protein TELCIR_19910, partial [Teladorsagia circumcincta]
IVCAMTAAGLHSYLRVVFASLLREGERSESKLFWCGVFIQRKCVMDRANRPPHSRYWNGWSRFGTEHGHRNGNED